MVTADIENMAEKTYPERQRCRKCNKKLNEVVLEGMFCSYRCGNFAQPYAKVDDAPRQCKTERDNKWEWKKKFRAENEIPKRILDEPATNVYRCSHCHYLHIGHNRATGTESARLIGDAKTLGTVLLRVREQRNQTQKQVASSLKIRPIRIKEIEEGNSTIDVDVLFKLVKYYRLKLNVLF